jgi:hypothetical protein
MVHFVLVSGAVVNVVDFATMAIAQDFIEHMMKVKNYSSMIKDFTKATSSTMRTAMNSTSVGSGLFAISKNVGGTTWFSLKFGRR